MGSMLLYAQASLPLLWLPPVLPPSTMSLKQMPRYLRLSVREMVQHARLCMRPMMSPAAIGGMDPHAMEVGSSDSIQCQLSSDFWLNFMPTVFAQLFQSWITHPGCQRLSAWPGNPGHDTLLANTAAD